LEKGNILPPAGAKLHDYAGHIDNQPVDMIHKQDAAKQYMVGEHTQIVDFFVPGECPENCVNAPG